MTTKDRDWEAFTAQNTRTAEGLTLGDIHQLRPYVKEHSGNLMVAGRWLPLNLFVKMHDTWGPGGPQGQEVLVHVYDPDGDGENDAEIWARNGHDAVAVFFDDDALLTAWRQEQA